MQTILSRTARLALAFIATSLSVGITAGAASASPEVIYGNLPTPLPGDLPSVPFYGEGISAFGGQVAFAGTARRATAVTATLSSYACTSGGAEAGTCQTSRGARFEWPITLDIYEVGAENEPGAKIASITRTFKIPYRPSASKKCTGSNAGGWYDSASGKCFIAKLVKITFPVPRLALPAKAILGIGFNTTSFGSEPVGPKPCNESPTPGCPYNLINVGVTEPSAATPSVGTDPQPEDAYLDTPIASDYCENEAAAGRFALSKGCWSGYQPTFTVKAIL